MAQHSIYGDVEITAALAVGGKVTATPGSASGELATKGQVDASYSQARLRSNHQGTQTSDTISDFNTAVDARVNAAVSAVVGAAPTAFDTLKEISDWIAGDESDTAALLTRVGDLETAVDALEAGSGGAVFKQDIGDNSASTFTVTHGLGTTDVSVEVFETAGNKQTVFPVITRPSTSTIVVDFSGTVIASGSHRVIVRGS